MDGLFLTGLNHRVAGVEVRERLSFSPERTPALLRAFSGRESLPEVEAFLGPGDEAAILSTCNRSEVYIRAADPASAAAGLRRFLARWARMAPGELESLLYCLHGEEAACHLLRVSAGLESLFAGENEILGQVKAAGELAHAAGSAGPVLEALFRAAARAGKRARTETEIGRAGLSTASVVVDLAQERLGLLDERRALLIGAGKISSASAHALVRAGLRCVLVANRTYERAQRLAENLGESCAQAVHFDALQQSLAEADIVICSTGAPHFVLHPGQVSAAAAARAGRPVLIVDLAVPRDVDPAVAAIPGVVLVYLDDLEELAQRRYPLAAAAREAAGAVVAEELDGFTKWLDCRSSAPLIRAMQEKAQEIFRSQVEQTVKRLGDLTSEQRQALEVMGRAMVKQLLHDPIQFLHQNQEGLSPCEKQALLREIFGLQPED